jgi:muramoyltetrapeptide carboxypeptidase
MPAKPTGRVPGSARSSRTYGIGLIAPAGFATAPDAVARAVARLEAAGHRVVVDPTASARWQRFSGSDEERLAALWRMAEDPRIELVLAVRGGYGWSRLLDRIDFVRLAATGKRWLGHSDCTAFQLAALARAGMVSFAGPMAAYDFGAEVVSDYTMEHCWGLLGSERYSIELPLEGPDFAAAGSLWGGNLTLLAHLVGTAYLPSVEGGILFVEDVGEHPYRLERMLYQLHYAGVLGRQRALLLGAFTGYAPSANDNGYDLAAMVAHARARFGVPVFTGLPFGHCPDKLTLPVGGRCALTVDDGRARIELSHYGP